MQSNWPCCLWLFYFSSTWRSGNFLFLYSKSHTDTISLFSSSNLYNMTKIQEEENSDSCCWARWQSTTWRGEHETWGRTYFNYVSMCVFFLCHHAFSALSDGPAVWQHRTLGHESCRTGRTSGAAGKHCVISGCSLSLLGADIRSLLCSFRLKLARREFLALQRQPKVTKRLNIYSYPFISSPFSKHRWADARILSNAAD